MTIAIDYDQDVNPNPGGGGYEDDEDWGDACSILVPIDLKAGGITSITSAYNPLPEDPRAQWNPATVYAAGAQIYLASTHRVYESVKDGNTGKDPSLPSSQYSAAGIATWWIDIGPTNKYAMFDGLVSSQTQAASPLSITLAPGAFNGFALFGVDADSFSVVVRDAPGGAVVYEEDNTALEATQPADYYEYFFDRFKPLRQFIRAGIDAYSTAEITLTLNRGTGNVGVGMLAIGDLRPVGIPQRDASVEPQDFSYVKQDAFGNTTVQKRANATGMSISAVMEKADANSVLDTIKEVLGVPVVVVGSQVDEFAWLTVFGLVSASMTPVPYPYATVKLSVKGFI